MLQPAALRRSFIPKRIARLLWQDRDLRRASCLHATSEKERLAIRESGFRDTPVAVIPNGVNLPDIADLPGRAQLAHLVPAIGTEAAYVLYLGRLHPFKGMLELLTAWEELPTRHRDATLVVAGPLEPSFTQDLSRALERQCRWRSIIVLGPVEGELKGALLANAWCLVLPSRSENFGMVVAESLAHRRPAIANTNAPWAVLNEQCCGWWIEPGVEALVAALDRALDCAPKDLEEMGSRGRAWVEGSLSWDRVGGMMVELYDWILRGGVRPGCVTYL
jgi:glycosyltransferase involved in cell wall biosynthesis